MLPLNYVRSKFIVRNLSKRAIKLLNRATIPPSGDPCDLFEIIPNLSEILIIDALRQPDGELYLATQIHKKIEILECDLVLFKNGIATFAPTAITQPTVETGPAAPVIPFDVRTPLKLTDGVLSIDQANHNQSGFISQDDFSALKEQNYKIRIWQYQDFENLTSNILSLDQFNNLDFDDRIIINESATAVDATNPENLLHLDNKLMQFIGKSRTIQVTGHNKSVVNLNAVPLKGQKVRIYFLVSVLINQVGNLEQLPQVPKSVIASRIELVDSMFIENTRKTLVIGDKKFSGTAVFEKIGVSVDDPKFSLEVNGTTKTKNIIIDTDCNNHYVLAANSLGQGKWSANPVVSDKSPTNAYLGQLWVKSPEYVLYYLNENNTWLTVNSEIISFRSSQLINTNCYMDVINGGYAGKDTYFRNRNCLIQNIVVESEESSVWKLIVYIGNSSMTKYEFETNGKNLIEFNQKIKVNKEDKVKIFVSGKNIMKPKVCLEIKDIME